MESVNGGVMVAWMWGVCAGGQTPELQIIKKENYEAEKWIIKNVHEVERNKCLHNGKEV